MSKSCLEWLLEIKRYILKLWRNIADTNTCICGICWWKKGQRDTCNEYKTFCTVYEDKKLMSILEQAC